MYQLHSTLRSYVAIAHKRGTIFTLCVHVQEDRSAQLEKGKSTKVGDDLIKAYKELECGDALQDNQDEIQTGFCERIADVVKQEAGAQGTTRANLLLPCSHTYYAM